MKRILLWDLPDTLMIVIEHPSGVIYQNQVGGVVCWQGEIEGVLAPLDASPESYETILRGPYPSGRRGIDAEIADTIDRVLASAPQTRFLSVDRSRLDESWEAWIYVVIDSPESDSADPLGPYFGASLGFGLTRGVLTWPNSD